MDGGLPMKKEPAPSKTLALRRALFEIAIEALKKKGWTVQRAKKSRAQCPDHSSRQEAGTSRHPNFPRQTSRIPP